ncbi:MAG: hypothetical protein COA88_03170 [Kordia sp.]|nr:MAG: hypothetical protein COA88_03170 [Kordia sp.]
MKKTIFYFLSLFSIYSFSQITEVSFGNRVSQSQVIIEGKILNQRSFWDNNKHNIYTASEIEIYKVFKGRVNTQTLEIITPGGTVGLKKEIVQPSLALSMNDVGVFMLKTNPIAIANPKKLSQFKPCASLQGFIKYNLAQDKATGPFDTFNSIEKQLYKSITRLTKKSIIELRQFSLDFQKKTSNNNSLMAPTISSFSPTTISAGTNSQLTINGTGFEATIGTVGFSNTNDGGASFVTTLPTEIISWSDTTIVVEVPDNAGTGTIEVTTAGLSSNISTQTLNVSYAQLNVDWDTGSGIYYSYQTQHVNDNATGGYTWEMNTEFASNANAVDAFNRGFNNWICETNINWEVSATTTAVDLITDDGINIIRFDNGAELPGGVLGRSHSRYSGCIVSGVDIDWYVYEIDINFDDATNWNFSNSLPGFTEYDFETIVLHELGHGHQEGHVIDTNELMHYSISNGESNRIIGVNDIINGNDIMLRNTTTPICSQAAMIRFPGPEIDIQGNGVSILSGDTTPDIADETDFGDVNVSENNAHIFTIDNTTGTVDLTISSIVSSGTNFGDFVVSNVPAIVTAGGTNTFTVTFTPSTTGTRTATITINNDDCNEGIYDFAVQGYGSESICNRYGQVTGDVAGSSSEDFLMGQKHTANTSNYVTSLGINSLATGVQVIIALYNDNAGAPGTLITQSASTALIIGDNIIDVPNVFINSGDYWIMKVLDTSSTPFSESSTGGGATTYYTALTFGSALPTNFTGSNYGSAGIFTTWMELCSVPEIDVIGNAISIADSDTTPDVADDTDFGNIDIESNDVHTFTIDNTAGTLDLTITSIVSSGTNSSDFVIGNVPATVTAGGTDTFTVTFTPSAAGTRTATITINNDDADEGIYDFAIQGNGLASILLSPIVYLQGAFINPNAGEETLMRDDLRTAGFISTISPYIDGATCYSSVFTTTGNNAIVDWIWVELRDASTNTTILHSQSALLQRDGDVVAIDGTGTLNFNAAAGNYYVAIKHRNHLGMMSANTVALSDAITILNFTDAASQITYGTNAQTVYGMPTGKVGMWAGNADGNSQIRYQGSGNDTNTIKDKVLADAGNSSNSNLYSFTAYNTADVNLNGTTRYQGSGNDSNTIKDIILGHPNNQSSPSNLFIILEQLPEN